jgi:hypothetical protein
MAKKCIICGGDAKLQIKGTSDFYCDECAADNFDDLNVLVSVEEKAKKVKDLVDNQVCKIGEPEQSEEPKE